MVSQMRLLAMSWKRLGTAFETTSVIILGSYTEVFSTCGVEHLFVIAQKYRSFIRITVNFKLKKHKKTCTGLPSLYISVSINSTCRFLLDSISWAAMPSSRYLQLWTIQFQPPTAAHEVRMATGQSLTVENYNLYLKLSLY